MLQSELDSNEDNDIIEDASCVVALVGNYDIRHLCKESCRNSSYTGHAWVHETLQGHQFVTMKFFTWKTYFP